MEWKGMEWKQMEMEWTGMNKDPVVVAGNGNIGTNATTLPFSVGFIINTPESCQSSLLDADGGIFGNRIFFQSPGNYFSTVWQ